jgi:surface protein
MTAKLIITFKRPNNTNITEVILPIAGITSDVTIKDLNNSDSDIELNSNIDDDNNKTQTLVFDNDSNEAQIEITNGTFTTLGYIRAPNPNSNIISKIENFNQNDNTSNITSLINLFRNNSYTLDDSEISNWNVSNVLNMSSMFFNATKFNQDISSWDVSKVTDMSSMFSSAENFNKDISNWNVSKVTNMSFMFFNASAFDNGGQPFQSTSTFSTSLGESGGLTNKTINMAGMFFNAIKFNQDISSWNVSKVTDISGMFLNAIKFNQDISNWNVKYVTNMRFIFSSASDFNIDISNWNVSNVTNMSGMFLNAIKFNQDISKWNVSKVTNMSRMFANASQFNKDISRWDVSGVIDMSNMFNGAEKFNNGKSSDEDGGKFLVYKNGDPNQGFTIFNSSNNKVVNTTIEFSSDTPMANNYNGYKSNNHPEDYSGFTNQKKLEYDLFELKEPVSLVVRPIQQEQVNDVDSISLSNLIFKPNNYIKTLFIIVNDIQRSIYSGIPVPTEIIQKLADDITASIAGSVTPQSVQPVSTL